MLGNMQNVQSPVRSLVGHTVERVVLFPQHFIGQREEFETARDSILVWLTEMDLQLTNIEHFSECDIQAKIKQLRVRLSRVEPVKCIGLLYSFDYILRD